MKNLILSLFLTGILSGSASAQSNPELSKALFDYQDCMRSSDNHILLGIAGALVSVPLIRSERLRPYGMAVMSCAVIPLTIGVIERRMAHGHMHTASLLIGPKSAGVAVWF